MDRSAAIRDMAGALQGLQNQCAFLMVVNAVYLDFVLIVQVVQYFFWQQSHVVISLCSGEALHFEQGVSPSFLPLTIFNYYPNFLIISWIFSLLSVQSVGACKDLPLLCNFYPTFKFPYYHSHVKKKKKKITDISLGL